MGSDLTLEIFLNPWDDWMKPKYVISDQNLCDRFSYPPYPYLTGAQN